MTIEVCPRTPEQIAGDTFLQIWTAIDSGQHGMELLALHIPWVLGKGADKIEHWRRREIPNGRAPLVIELTRPEDYFLKKPREGLGLPSLYFLDGVMKLLGRDGTKALAVLRDVMPDWDQRIDLESGNRLLAMETKRGGDRKSEEYKSSGNFPIDNTQSSRADSNGISDRTQRKLDRLAKDRPDLLDRVKAKELSVQAAAIEAGIVKAPDVMELAKRAIGKMTTAQRLKSQTTTPSPYPLCRFTKSTTPEKQPVSGTAGAKFAEVRRRSPTIGENTG